MNIASTAGLSGDRYIAAYAASKHALIGLTRCVAAEAAAHGVTVNAVCPGFLDTSMTARAIDRVMAATGRSREQALDAVAGRNPQRRLIDTEEVAAAVLIQSSRQAVPICACWRERISSIRIGRATPHL